MCIAERGSGAVDPTVTSAVRSRPRWSSTQVSVRSTAPGARLDLDLTVVAGAEPPAPGRSAAAAIAVRFHSAVPRSSRLLRSPVTGSTAPILGSNKNNPSTEHLGGVGTSGATGGSCNGA